MKKDKGFSHKRIPKTNERMDPDSTGWHTEFINNYSSNPLYYFTFVLGYVQKSLGENYKGQLNTNKLETAAIKTVVSISIMKQISMTAN